MQILFYDDAYALPSHNRHFGPQPLMMFSQKPECAEWLIMNKGEIYRWDQVEFWPVLQALAGMDVPCMAHVYLVSQMTFTEKTYIVVYNPIVVITDKPENIRTNKNDLPVLSDFSGSLIEVLWTSWHLNEAKNYFSDLDAVYEPARLQELTAHWRNVFESKISSVVKA
ncbi:MAG: hypothetical protein HGA31_02500 [Candidatus Moranbacteria bacterium]|nr:hypothetical protein [Candidatus Moranbacteria bacterium]